MEKGTVTISLEDYLKLKDIIDGMKKESTIVYGYSVGLGGDWYCCYTKDEVIGKLIADKNRLAKECEELYNQIITLRDKKKWYQR